MFLKNIWYIAGWSDEFPAGTPHTRTIIDSDIVLYRKTDKSLVAFQRRCPHRWAPLDMGRIEGDDLRCMYHGLKFNADGACVAIPGQQKIPANLRLQSYPLVERHRFVWIWLGAQDLADPDLIPDLDMLDAPDFRVRHGQIDYAADQALICDNLLDLSHVNFVHERTLGQAVSGQDRPTFVGGESARPIERGVEIASWACGAASRTITEPEGPAETDRWGVTKFLVPGIFISRLSAYPAGAAATFSGGPPDDRLSPLSDSFSVQAITPITAARSRYFYSMLHRSSDIDDKGAQRIWQVVQEAFFEDLRMIEAQQKIVDKDPGGRMAVIASDKGLVLYRRLTARLLKEENIEVSGVRE